MYWPRQYYQKIDGFYLTVQSNSLFKYQHNFIKEFKFKQNEINTKLSVQPQLVFGSMFNIFRLSL